MDSIFTHFVARGDAEEEKTRLSYAAWFTEAIPMIEFQGEELLFWDYLDYSVNLGVPIKFKYFQVWLSTELREVLHKTKTRVTGCETLSFDDPLGFETIYKTTCDILTDNFKVLESLESNLEDFKVEISSFMTNRRNQRLTKALSDTYDVLNKTDSAVNAADYALDSINIINDVYDVTKLDDLDFKGDPDEILMNKVSDCGLPAIDKDSQGLFSTQLLGVEAQPGTGKTRFTLGTYCYRAITVYHKNVLFLALEQTEAEIRAMMTACHVFHMFNSQISDKMILTGQIPDELVAKVNAAKFDLFESGKYGKFVCKETDLYVETFITKIRTLDKLQGPFDLIAIDYMGLIESKPQEYKRALSEYEIIKSAFKYFKKYLRRSKKAGIAVSQFNREGIEAGKNDKAITTEMAQGGIAVYRNTDYNIAISMTETMRLQQKRRFSQPKVRSSAGFPSFIVDTRLGFCYFKQVVQKDV